MEVPPPLPLSLALPAPASWSPRSGVPLPVTWTTTLQFSNIYAIDKASVSGSCHVDYTDCTRGLLIITQALTEKIIFGPK